MIIAPEHEMFATAKLYIVLVRAPSTSMTFKSSLGRLIEPIIVWAAHERRFSFIGIIWLNGKRMIHGEIVKIYLSIIVVFLFCKYMFAN